MTPAANTVGRTVLVLGWLALGAQLAGCASLAEGVTRAVLDKRKTLQDTRQCHVVGPSFRGLQVYMDRQERLAEVGYATGERPTLKVLMVHGIGTHHPGYSTRLHENLAAALQLEVRDNRSKALRLQHPDYPGQLMGMLQVNRYQNRTGSRELVFYELTWSEIIAEEKALLAYDSSGEHAFRRTTLNGAMKRFSNEHMPDPLIYLGKRNEQILRSVSQSMCLAFSRRWSELPESGDISCQIEDPRWLSRLEDDFAFVSHSLGSRVVIDALQAIAEIVRTSRRELDEAGDKRHLAKLESGLTGLQQKSFPVFMLSNQLLLLQLGRETAPITGKYDEYCLPGGSKTGERLFQGVDMIAFSDPNDILSYAVPPDFVDDYMDSRLCPSMVNISINVADIIDIFGLGQLANPMDAHREYDDDERVIALVTRGIGNEKAAPIVAERCDWLETRN